MSFFKQILRILIYAIIITRTINPIVALILLISTAISIQIPKIVGQLTAKRRQTYLESKVIIIGPWRIYSEDIT